jgi:hypothetical protein
MAIEGLNNIYRVPTIKKEQEPVNQQKKQKKKNKKNRGEKEDHQKDRKGGIDIRI